MRTPLKSPETHEAPPKIWVSRPVEKPSPVRRAPGEVGALQPRGGLCHHQRLWLAAAAAGLAAGGGGWSAIGT